MNIHKNFISVIIPLYNGIEFLNICLNSVKKQTIKDWEIIVGLNGIELNSDIIKKARQFENEKIRIIHYKDTKGRVNTLNKMVKDTKYNIICLLDVDDLLHPLKFEKQLPILKKYDVVSSNCRYFGDRNDCPYLVFGDLTNFDFLRFNPIINSGTFLKKTDCIFPQTFPMCQDYEKWLEMKLKNKKFYVLKEQLTYIRIHKKSYFNNSNFNYLPALKSMYKKLFDKK